MLNLKRVDCDVLFVICIVILAGLIRLSHTCVEGLWLDEAISVQYAKSTLSDIVKVKGDLHPPLYYLLLYFWARISMSDWWLRFMSVCINLLTIPPLYVLARHIGNRYIARFAIIIFSISPIMFYYSNEVRSYALCVFWSVAGTCAFVKMQGRYHLKYTMAYVIISALSLYTHYYLGLLILSQAVYLLFSDDLFKRSSYWIIVFSCITGLFLPWLPKFLEQATGGSGIAYTNVPKLKDYFDVLYSFTTGNSQWLSPGFLSLGPWYNLAILSFFLVLTVAGYIVLLKIDGGRPGLLLLLLLLPLGLVFLVAQFRPIFAAKYFIYSAPYMYILISAGTCFLVSRYARFITSVAVICIMAAITYKYSIYSDGWREDARGAALKLSNVASSGDVIMFPSIYQSTSLRHYFTPDKHITIIGAKQLIIPDDRKITANDQVSLATAVNNALSKHSGHKLYYIECYIEHNDPSGVISTILNKNCTLNKSYVYRRFPVYEYQL